MGVLLKKMLCWKGGTRKTHPRTIEFHRNELATYDDESETPNKHGHLYLIKEREFIKTKENIFKIGKSTNIKGRMPAYPKDSLIYVIAYCPRNVHAMEKTLIQRFDCLFNKRVDIGYEYYETADEDHWLIMYEFLKLILE